MGTQHPDGSRDHGSAEGVHDDKPGIFDNPRNVRRVIFGLYAACAVVFVLDIVSWFQARAGVPELRHPDSGMDGLPGFYAFYGFVACVLLVLAAREMRKILMRREEYYDDG
ncbi:MAG: hypothetical protein OXG58_06580 [Gemmatimonadetes bacterium]|nr:hypothetical protein [Gemmatimonadota bacterium]MCY3944097.1 hypothetical protein [Gemmatimonadota bacterium]